MELGSMQGDTLEIGQNITFFIFFIFLLATSYTQSYVADGSIYIHNMKLACCSMCMT